MTIGLSLLAGMLAIVSASQNPSAEPTPRGEAATKPQPVASRPSLKERTAQANAHLETPESLYELKQIIEQCYLIQFSIEPLPEQCAGATEPDAILDPFWILDGEHFTDVIARLEAASQGRWIFEEIRGVPLLRPNHALPGHGTLLDTVISADIQASSMWEALCALARAVNQANNVTAHKARPLIIRFLGPTLMKHPASMFIEKKSIRLALEEVTAREGLCAILAEVGENIQYSYTCVAKGRPPEYDYIDISAFDSEGSAINGGRMSSVDYERLLKTEDWMSDEGILAVQAPALDNADGPAKP